ncbi:MAG: phosphoribosyltransferase [Polyangia bacterium]
MCGRRPIEAPRREIGWQEYGELCKRLALEVRAHGSYDAVVGIARGGAIVGATLSFMLNLEYFPIRLGKRGGVTRVIVPPTRDLAGRKVVLVDDLSRTGDTFKIALYELKRVGAASITTVALVRREPGFRPDLCAVTASAVDKVAFPWGREELVGDRFELRKL